MLEKLKGPSRSKSTLIARLRPGPVPSRSDVTSWKASFITELAVSSSQNL